MDLSPSTRALPTLGLALALLAPPSARAQGAAEEPRWTKELSTPVSYAHGHTSYRIEAADSVSSVASELEFPIRTALVGLRARFAAPRQPGRGGPAFEVEGHLAALSQETAKLKDSDWIDGQIELQEVGALHAGKDIYSESKAKLSGRVLEARAAWEMEVSPGGAVVAPMAGFLYQRFEYEVTDVRQVGYGPWSGETGAFDGPVLDYEVSYLLPYVGARAAAATGVLTGTAELWLSPVASADDFDDHLLRGKNARTDASGSAWAASVTARLAVGSRGALQAQASFLRVSATGTQRQTFYAGSDAGLRLEIPSTITSSRATFGLAYVHSL
jgi:hypothetical protein